MGWLFQKVGLAVIGVAICAGSVLAQRPVPAALESSAQPIVARHPALQASLDRIATRSALWRAALADIRRTGRRAVVLPADEVVVETRRGERPRRFDRTILAEVAPVPRPDSRVEVVMAVVNVALIEEQHLRRGSWPWELEDDFDRILIHEIYGHAVPYLLAGDLSGHCPDPQPGERATDACAIRRENAVRAELGLGRRTHAGLDGLALTRPGSR